MAHISKPGTNPHIEQMLAPKPVLQQARVQTKQAHQTTGRENIELAPANSVEDKAGVRHGIVGRMVNIGHTAAVVMRLAGQRYVPMRGARGSRVENKDQSDEQRSLLEAVQDSLDLLGDDSGRGNRERLEAQLERYFEPLQHLKVLVQSLQQLENQDVSGSQKNKVGRALNAMITSLMRKHPHEIRAVLQETEENGVKLDPMSEDLQSSVRLRLLIGAKDAGKFDTPLSPLTVLKALIRNFGGNCLLAMTSVRARMMSGF